MFRWPTSEFPICPAGSPTARPEASSVVHGDSRKRRSNRGLSAWAMALYSRSLRQPNPSRTMRMRNGRCGMEGGKYQTGIEFRISRFEMKNEEACEDAISILHSKFEIQFP